MLISTIIPVYNASKTINRCVDSLLEAQTDDVLNEIILVNDGSMDNSLEICLDYERRNSNIKVITQENQGPSVARNRGIEVAEGEFITFVDSDDYVAVNYLSDFRVNANPNNDISMQGIRRFGNNDERIVSLFNDDETLFLYDFLNKYALHPNFAGPYSKAFNRTIIINNDLKFDKDLSYGEDAKFVIEYLSKCKNIYTTKSINYFYRNNLLGLSKVFYNFQKDNYLFNIIKQIINQNYKTNLVNSGFHLRFLTERTIQSIYKDTNNRTETFKYLEYFVIQNKKEVLYIYKNAKFRGKLIYFLIKYNLLKTANYLLTKIYA